MIGSTEFGNALMALLREPINAWENTLESCSDEMVYVDGEEGDFGIVSYYETGSDGVTKTRMMVEYIHGGDRENTYYTAEGIARIKELFGHTVGAAFEAALQETLDPPEGEEGLYIGLIRNAKEQDAAAAALIQQAIDAGITVDTSVLK